MYETMSMEVWKRRREEMLREAERDRLKGTMRGDRSQPAVPRLISAVTWKLARVSGLLRKSLRAPTSAG